MLSIHVPDPIRVAVTNRLQFARLSEARPQGARGAAAPFATLPTLRIFSM